MKIYILICVILIVYKGASVGIRPELQRNILSFGYGMNQNMKGFWHIHLTDSMWSQNSCCP